jgi:uncharacterized membrane protein
MVAIKNIPASTLMQLFSGLFHRLFRLSLIVKAADGCLQITGGVFIMLSSAATLDRIFTAVLGPELYEAPRDIAVNFIANSLAHMDSGTQLYIGLFALAHGAVNVLVVTGLLQEKPWAFPLSGGIIGTFVFYQLFRLTGHYSLLLAILTIIDTVTILLIWNEYLLLSARARKYAQ